MARHINPKGVNSAKPCPTRPEILADLLAGKLELEEASELLVIAIRRENDQVQIKVSPKGGVSIYGVAARLPITLYAGQWRRLMKHIDKINEFIIENEDELNWKDYEADLRPTQEEKDAHLEKKRAGNHESEQ